DHIRGGEARACEHQLWMDADALRPQRGCVKGPEGVDAFDHAETALRRYDVEDLRGIALRAGEGQHDVDAGKTRSLELRLERLAVIDHVLGAEALDPVLRLRT